LRIGIILKNIIFAVAFICLNAGQSYSQAKEDFNTFFKKFEHDKAFQLSRITFPVKVLQIDEDDKRKKVFISKAKWEYTDLLSSKKEKYILKIGKVKNNECAVNVMIEDTGVMVTHTFQLRSGKWWLILIEDAST
jgi:hypothetical protein